MKRLADEHQTMRSTPNYSGVAKPLCYQLNFYDDELNLDATPADEHQTMRSTPNYSGATI
jgi:hypothetical protein